MYRNVWVKNERNPNGSFGQNVYLTTWDENGNPITKVHRSYKAHLYHEIPSELKHLSTETSMFGTPLTKKTFNTTAQRKKWIEENPDVRVFESLPLAKQFLSNTFAGQEREKDFTKFPFKIYTIDIELAVGKNERFPEAMLAEKPINLITVHDSIQDRFFIWYMTPNEKDITIPENAPKNRLYMRFKSEVKLLANFLDFWMRNPPDIVTGWNISAFDMPYIFNRATKVLGTLFDVPGMLSPAGNVYYVDDHNLMAPILKIGGVTILDYMYLYKFKFERGKPSYALDKILGDELNVSKLDHSEYASFYDFYTEDFSKFTEYNIIDVERVVQLDKVKKFIALSRKLCNLGLVEYDNIYHTQPYVEGAVSLQAKKMGKIFMSHNGLVSESNPAEESKGPKFKGAYVHNTKVGFYKRGGFTFDLNSLYPSLMRMLNCSPETKIGKIIADDPDPFSDDVKIQLRGKSISQPGDVITLSKEKYDDLLKNKCSKAENGVLYVKYEIQPGIMPKFLEWLYAERRAAKNEMLKIEKRISEIRTSENPDTALMSKLHDESSVYDNMQNAYKIMLNSVYGLIGLQHYCCYDVDNAEAVTLSGRAVLMGSLDIIRQICKEDYNFESGDKDGITIAGDTDSMMNDGEVVYNKVFGNRETSWSKEDVKIFKEEANKICTKLNTGITDYCMKYFHSNTKTIEFKLETVFSHGVFLKKKHYVYRMVDKEGAYMVGSPKQFKYTGVDIKRNQIPKPVQKCLKEVVERGMLEEWDQHKYHMHIMQLWRDFKKMPPEDIAIQFAYKTEKESAGFLALQAHTHITAKVAIFYNHMIDELKLYDQEKIKLGDNAKYVYVKPGNSYGIDVVGFRDEYPKKFFEIFDIDRATMFNKLYDNKLEHFREVFGWKPVDVKNIPKMDIMSI